MMEKCGNLTFTELASCLGVARQTAYSFTKDRNLPFLVDGKKQRVLPIGVRQLLEERGFTYPKKNIAFQIVKGGVGKTSLSFSLGVRSAHYGARVLMIDMDQQGNLTQSFDIDSLNIPVWLNLIRDNVSIEKSILKVNDFLHLIPSNLNNSRLDVELTSNSYNLKELLKNKLASIRDNYDLVIIDCPPAINKLNTAAACGSDLVIIPINPDKYSTDGLNFTLFELEKIRREFQLDFDYKIIWNKYDARKKLALACIHGLSSALHPEYRHAIDKLIPFVLPVDTSMENAIFKAETLFDNNKKSPLRDEVDRFTREILGIYNWLESKKKGTQPE